MQGLIDAHVHMLFGGLTMQQIDLRQVTSKAGFVSAVKTAAGELTKPINNVHARVSRSFIEHQHSRPTLCKDKLNRHKLKTNAVIVLLRCLLILLLSSRLYLLVPAMLEHVPAVSCHVSM